VRTWLARSIGIVALVAAMIGPTAPGVAAASPDSRPSGPAAAGAHAPHAAGVSPATSAGYNWVDGVINENATFLYGDSFSGWMIGYDSAYVGYYPWTDSGGYPTGAFPQVGDVYYMHVVVAVVGNPGSGGDMPNIQVQLPDNTELAISSSNPTYCYFIGPSTTPTTCPTPGTGTILPIWLGTVPVASYYMFEEQFPVVTTAPLDGISNPGSYLANYNDWAIGEFDSGAQEYDWQPIWVPPIAVDTTITSKPASSTSSTSASFSFTSNLGGSAFQCRLDSGSWAACGSPKSYSGLAAGSHTFHVAAVDGIGRVDPTPASYTWSIIATPGPAKTLVVAGLPNPFVAGAAHSVAVTAHDTNGARATGYRGTIHFTSSDTKAGLPANYTFTAADAGLHVFSTAVTLKTAGTQSVSATDTVTASIKGTQSGIVVQPAAAATLTVSGIPSPYVAGDAHSLAVTAHDAFGNRATGYRGTIHFSSSDAKSAVPANYTFTAADGGMHIFSHSLAKPLILKTAGTQSVTATDTVTASIHGAQTGISVTAAALSKLVVSGMTTPRTAGSTGSIRVTATDAYGNRVSSYRGTIHFTSSDAKAKLPANYAFTATDAGTHVFSANVILKTVGTQSVTATDTVTASIKGSQTGISVTPAAATTIVVSGLISPRAAGVAGSLAVTARDAYGNVATGYRGTIHFSSSDTKAVLPANYTFTAAAAGTHTFSLGVTLKTVGTQSVTATDTVTVSIKGSETGIVVT
jgi:hypothetical protein